jgi:hypothetical protein
MGSTALKQDRDSGHVSPFRELSAQFCSTLGRYGIPFRPYESDALPHFSALPSERQSLILTGFREFLTVCAESESSGESLLDTKRLLWRTLARMKMAPQGDILDLIEDGDIVEVYLPDFHQVFRNLEFFRFISCTLEELVAWPLQKLGDYPPETMAYFGSQIHRLNSGELKHPFLSDLPAYRVTENGAEKYLLEIKVKYLSPILENGVGKAIIATNRSKIVGRAG